MAKVEIKGLDKLQKNIMKLLKNDLATKKTLDDIGASVVARVQSMARSGFTLFSGKKTKLKKLSKSYVAMRQGAVKFRTMPSGHVVGFQEPDPALKDVDPEFFNPSLSQLTFTGQMLRALGFKSEKYKVSVEIKDGIRWPVQTGGKAQKTLTNKEVADFVAKQGRPFLGLDKQGVARVKKILLDSIRKAIINNRLGRR
jgi:hypothetical protein